MNPDQHWRDLPLRRRSRHGRRAAHRRRMQRPPVPAGVPVSAMGNGLPDPMDVSAGGGSVAGAADGGWAFQTVAMALCARIPLLLNDPRLMAAGEASRWCSGPKGTASSDQHHRRLRLHGPHPHDPRSGFPERGRRQRRGLLSAWADERRHSDVTKIACCTLQKPAPSYGYDGAGFYFLIRRGDSLRAEVNDHGDESQYQTRQPNQQGRGRRPTEIVQRHFIPVGGEFRREPPIHRRISEG